MKATVIEFKPVPPPKPDPKAKFCTSCHYVGRGRYPGSLWFYPFLYALYVIPGLLYYIYRSMAGQCICWKCKAKTLIPADAPRAVALQAEDHYRSDRARSSTTIQVTRNT